MDKEIGGYFGIEKFYRTEYYSNLIRVNLARNALLYIIKVRNIKKLYIPYYLCDSVFKLCDREGIKYEYYSIDEQFLPNFHKILEADEWLYVVNYFGQINAKLQKKLKKKYGNIIVDNVQAFFQKPVSGIDTIYSCRKFFGVPDGAYLSTDANLDYELDKDVSKNRMEHVLGRYDENNANKYFEIFKEVERDFDKLELKAMSNLTQNILSGVNYKVVKKERERNYRVLSNKLNKANKLKLLFVEGPYVYPFYCENGVDVRSKLAKRGVYVATLWPNVLNYHSEIESDYVKNILPLPVDQRYTVEDMDVIASLVLECVKEKGIANV